MIQTVEGKLGGSKTYMVMGWICNQLAKGGIVATNINIQLDAFEDQFGKKRGLRWVLDKHYNYTLQDRQLIRLSDVNTVPYEAKKGVVDLLEIVMFYKMIPRGTPECPVFVAIDEAHLHFPQDGFRTIPNEVLAFLTLSRHACVDIVFISQHIKNMWCQMARLAEYRWGVRDMKKYGVPVGFVNLPWPFPHFLQIKHDSDGTIMARHMEWARKYLYETYRSPEVAAGFESMPAASKVEIEERGMSMKDKWIIFTMGLAVGLAVLVVPACKSREGVSHEHVGSSLVGLPSAHVEAPSKVEPELSANGSGSEESVDVEYYKGHVESGWDSKFFTSSRTYYLGDEVAGLFLVLVRSNEMVLLDKATGEYFEKWFPSSPLPREDG